jgi:O-antigen ligase
MNRKICNIILYVICFTLIFNNTPQTIRMNIWGGQVGGGLVFYPLVVGFIYTGYCQYKYQNILVYFDKFLKFTLVYMAITMLSLIIGLYNYPYYDLVFSGPVSQIEKLPHVITFFASHDIVLDQKFALGAWMIARQIKGIFLEIFWCFGGAYMIFCWYYNNWQKAVRIMIKGILAGLFIIFSYSLIEVFYLTGNVTAKNILEIITPYFHPIKAYMGWHPPLLWKGQVRSIFSEPSNMGNYIAIAIPVLWCCYLRKISLKFLLNSFVLIFLVFLTQARTAYAMLFGMTGLLFLLLLIIRRKALLKQFSIICITVVIAFGAAVQFIGIMNKDSSVTANNVIENNFTSLISSNQRSNGARYALLKSNLRIAADHPILGIGKGLAAAYITDYYTDSETKNGEVSMWINCQKEYGVLASKYSVDNAFNEYVTRLSQTGILGLSVFLFPFIWVLVKLFDMYKQNEKDKQIDVLLILFALTSSLVAGCNGSVTVIYGTWILLGIAFAAVYSEKYSLKNAHRTSK